MCTTIPRSHSPNVALKWHQLRRQATDPGALRTNLEAGLAEEAVMETDLRLTRDSDWVCLHDSVLDAETTGHGMVADHASDQIRRLETRTPAGTASGATPLFLEDLVRAVEAWPLGAVELQLDLKVTSDELTEPALERLAAAVTPLRDSFSLSGTDATVLARVRDAVPGLAVTLSSSGRLGGARDAAVFESRMQAELDGLDGLSMIWVNHRVLQAAYRARFDLVGYAHQYGVGVDTGTIDVGASGWRAALVLALQAKVDRITSNSPCAIAEQVARWTEGSQRTAAAAS